MSENPNRTTVVLHGGPTDGLQYQISVATLRHGYFFVAVPPKLTAAWEFSREVATYQRRRVGEGQMGTCEARIWDEWHYVGSEVKDG